MAKKMTTRELFDVFWNMVRDPEYSVFITPNTNILQVRPMSGRAASKPEEKFEATTAHRETAIKQFMAWEAIRRLKL